MGACYTEETGTQKDIRASFYERASRDNATACHPGTASCATCAACATSATRTTRATYADRVSASHGDRGYRFHSVRETGCHEEIEGKSKRRGRSERDASSTKRDENLG